MRNALGSPRPTLEKGGKFCLYRYPSFRNTKTQAEIRHQRPISDRNPPEHGTRAGLAPATQGGPSLLCDMGPDPELRHQAPAGTGTYLLPRFPLLGHCDVNLATRCFCTTTLSGPFDHALLSQGYLTPRGGGPFAGPKAPGALKSRHMGTRTRARATLTRERKRERQRERKEEKGDGKQWARGAFSSAGFPM